jgi:predicted nucleic acid-binding protein
MSDGGSMSDRRNGHDDEKITGNVEPVDGKCNGLNRFGRYCPKDPMIGRTRCYHHAGKSLQGIAHPNFKHGRHVKTMPQRLLERYEASQTDPTLLELTDEISLVDARVADLLARSESGESGQSWKELHQLWRLFSQARRSGDRDQMATMLDQVGHAISRGHTDQNVWVEIGLLIDRRQRLVESERKRLAELENTLTVEQAKLIVRRVLDAVQRHVTDQKALSAIGGELSRLVAGDAVPLALTSGRSRRRRRG